MSHIVDVVRSTRAGQVVGQAGESLEEALDKAMPTAQALIAKLRDLGSRPDEIEVGSS